MKTEKSLLRILAVAAAVALPAQGLADHHDKPGFYIGGGAHINNAEFAFSKTYANAASSNLTLQYVGTAEVNGGSDTAVSSMFTSTAENLTAVITADDKSAFGFGFHGGYRINQYFAVEGSYAILGEFTGKVNVSLPGGHLQIGASSAATDIDITSLTGKYTAEVTAISGAAIGTYPLADNATVFGRLGYYSVTVDESLMTDAYRATGNNTAIDANGEGAFSAGTLSINRDLAGDGSGFLFGGGVEIKFGRQENILVRAEFELLSDAIAEEEAITRFGVTGSYSF